MPYTDMLEFRTLRMKLPPIVFCTEPAKLLRHDLFDATGGGRECVVINSDARLK